MPVATYKTLQRAKTKTRDVEMKRPKVNKLAAVKFGAAMISAIRETKKVIMTAYRTSGVGATELNVDRLYEGMRWWDRDRIDILATNTVDKINNKHSNDFYKDLTNSIGINVGGFTSEQGIQGILETAVDDNVEQITDLGEADKARVKRILKKALVTERGVSTRLTTELLKGFNTSIAQARFIARDQTQRLNNSLNQFRQQRSGIEEYRWATSKDGSVRPEHRKNDGKIFRWDSPPPETGHPGEDYNCRCVPIPIIKLRNTK